MTRRWRLFPKYALLIITLVGSMLIASGAIGLYFSWRETEAHLRALQDEKAQNAATRIEQFALDIEHQLSWTALPRADADGDALEQRRIEYLKLQRQAPAITEVSWIDPEGREQLRISRLAMDSIGSGTDLSKEEKFLKASKGEPYYGPVYFRKGTEPYMTIARPAGSGGGVTAAEVNLKFVWDVVKDIKIDVGGIATSGIAYVVDANGVLIAHPDISLVLKKSDLSILPQVAARVRPGGAAPAAARDLKGEEVFTASALIRTLRWTVFVETPRTEAFAPLYQTLRLTSLFLVAALVISIAASFFLARALVRPLRALQEGAAKIGAGDLERHIEVRTGDELEGLAEQFNRMTGQLRESYAGLERKVEQRTAELTESLRQQTATAEVLRVISGSVADSKPVFEKILESCERLFASNEQGILLVGEDNLLHLGAHHGGVRERVERLFPVPRAVGDDAAHRERVVINIKDVLGDADVPASVRVIAEQLDVGTFSQVIAPMLWEGEPIGSLYVIRQPAVGFTEKEIGLLRTFADQAVIAIQNARLFNETREALEQQRASADVLTAISNSISDAKPVFDVILQSCQRLFEGHTVGVTLLREDGLLDVGANAGPSYEALKSSYPRPLDRSTASGVAILERRVVTFEDIDSGDVPIGSKEGARAMGNQSMAVAPMLFRGDGIGTLWVGRAAPGPFMEKEIGLLRTFADQAVIAIQNARLFNETREALRKVELRTAELSEALDYQTSISDVLRVISQSPTNVAPVFEAILDSAFRLFGSPMSAVFRYDGRFVHLAATRNWPAAAIADASRFYPGPPNPKMMSGRVILSGEVQNEQDALNDPNYDQRTAGLGLWRRMIGAPLLRDGQPIGAIIVSWPEPGVTPARQADLLKTFADQAVIAIENVRLLSETTEALEQQTATAEVLQVISSSVADTAPVFDKILDSCERLFAATGLGIYLVDADGLLRKAGFRSAREKPERALAGTFPLPLEGTATEIAIRERRVVHYGDVLAAPDAPAPLVRIAKAAGSFSIAFAPMLWEGRGVGAIQVSRDPPQPFSDKELALLKTFAGQAVIAIQNARLFNEIQAKSRELEMANKHKSEFLANMSHELRTPLNAIIGFSEVLSERMFGEVNDKQLEYLLDIHSSGHHLLSLINDILDLSKIEAGRMELDLATTSLPMLLDNCTTLVRERASRQGLVLSLEVDDGLGDWVADIRKLKQVVINLLSNAVKFTPAGGRVTLRARRLEHAVEIAVVDTGVGIPPDQQALVFEEFRQAGGDYLRKSEGTGLGLSLAKKFVELHGGTMRVESEPGRGSTFAFILPGRVLEAV